MRDLLYALRGLRRHAGSPSVLGTRKLIRLMRGLLYGVAFVVSETSLGVTALSTSSRWWPWRFRLAGTAELIRLPQCGPPK
jgi:hypothetical protein